MPVDAQHRERDGAGGSPSDVGSMSTSSYSQTPSWTTVRPPAETKRPGGEVGRPNSSARPSAVSPRVDDGEGALGPRRPAGSGRGRWTRSRWSRLGFTKEVVTRTERLVGAQLEDGRRPRPVCSPTRAWEEPSTWSGQA